MGAFVGQLNKNDVYKSLYNMIITQEIFDDRISQGNDLVDLARTDGGLYGDTKLYYSTDILHTKAWGGDAEATNLLNIDRAPDPECQAITLDSFRIVPLTLDDYLSKRAWSDEGTFGQFNAYLSSLLGKTKYIYETTRYDTYLGTSADADHTVSVNTAVYGSTLEDEVKAVGDALANLIDKMCSPSTKFNDYGQHTKFRRDQIQVIWNTAWLNKFRKVDMPAIFHKDMIFDTDITQRDLNAQYFGAISSETTVPSEGTYRAVTEITAGGKEYFGGEIVPAGTTVEANTVYKSDCTDDDVTINSDYIALVVVKLPPLMSAFEVGSEFWNPRSLTRNRYLIWGENTLEHLKAYPFILLKKAS